MNGNVHNLKLEFEDSIIKVATEGITDVLLDGETVVKDYVAKIKTDGETIISEDGVLKAKANVQSEFSFTNSYMWNINHKLNKQPCVITVDENGEEIIGTIEYTTANNCIIYFTEPQSGTAYVN